MKFTTHIINARNVNKAYVDALWWLHTAGVPETTRNGEAVVAPGPVLVEYTHPMERVLFHPTRHANPYFHFMEALWMISGSNDVAWIQQFNRRIASYSDDGVILNGAYGDRWRYYFGHDQLESVVKMIVKDKFARRACIAMWDPRKDLLNESKDIPCNTHIYLEVKTDWLNMTVMARSNDAVWGAYGSNFVHFTMLQEYLAMSLCVHVGTFRQFSHNLHVYPQAVPNWDSDAMLFPPQDPYTAGRVQPMPMISNFKRWQDELKRFMEETHPEYNVASCTLDFEEPFFAHVAVPMYNSWMYRKLGWDALLDHVVPTIAGGGLPQAMNIVADDWRLACVEWIGRANQKKEAT